MSRKTIEKNLAYDTERQLYYAVFRENGQRHTRTFRTREEARAALADRSGAGGRLPARGVYPGGVAEFLAQRGWRPGTGRQAPCTPTAIWPGAM